MNSSNNNIQHTALLASDLEQLLKKNDKADVTFIVENKRIQAHRMILAARSEYFKALLYGALMESKQDEIVLKVQLKPFEFLLRYIYTGSLSLENVVQGELLEIIMLADLYGLIELKKAIGEYLCKKISTRNVCIFLRCSSLFQLASLYAACLKYMDEHAARVVLHESFPTLTFTLLNALLDRKSFLLSAVQKFQAIHKWCQHQKESAHNMKNLYRKVSFSSMSYNQLFHIVRPTGVLTPDELLDVIAAKEHSVLMHSRPIGSSTYCQRNDAIRYVP